MADTTLLIIKPHKSKRESLFSIEVADTGEVLATHFCSGGNFAYGDLFGNRPERQKEWKERFGEVEVKFGCELNEG